MVSPDPPEDRRHEGTKAERREHVPLGVRVRYAVAIVVSLIAAYAATQAFITSQRVSNDEYNTCVIQARGLPAGHELAASMTDIHRLLTLTPTSEAQRLAAKNTPPAVFAIVFDLNAHLARYQADEREQPQTRKC
jgi:hypothetical protein